ncbi:MAG: hypothetical protein RL685_7713, partial [Pseudomonadota bacterium]
MNGLTARPQPGQRVASEAMSSRRIAGSVNGR